MRQPPAAELSESGSSSTLDADTLSPGSAAKLDQALERVPTLTIAYHPEVQRIGEQARLEKRGPIWFGDVSRVSPAFMDAGGKVTGPLRHRFVSRQPLTVTVTAREVQIASEQAFKVDHVPASGTVEVVESRLAQGIVLELAGGVLLVLKLQRPAMPSRLGLQGVSDAIAQLRQEIERVAPQDTAVLIQGETGVGKELVARALHACSHRAEKSLVAVNMAAIPKDTAAGELFGYKKGAFTGAAADHPGYFGMAEAGTLFLDEIGEAPEAVQPVLLRALENGEVQPLGSSKAKLANVRVVAATDANLAALVERGAFKQALLHRLGGYQLKVAPLRERKEDIAILFLEFLRGELKTLGASALLAPKREESWLRSRIVAQLLAHDWPGNVRELRNVASQLAQFSATLPRSELPPALATLGRPAQTNPPQPSSQHPPGAATPPPKAPEPPQKPSDVTDERLIATLKSNNWGIAATARALGISKNSLYELIENCPSIRKARDLTKAEILKVQEAHSGDLDEMASALQVSLRGLQLRMKELGLR